MTDYQPVPPPPPPYPGTPEERRTPTLSILAIIFGILGAVLSLFVFGTGFLPGAAGVVLGFLGRRREPQARGLWLTGIITGFVAIALSIIWVIIFAIGIAVARSSGSY
ncbi:hypothetical protein QDR37_08320 [Amnibacterium sp. CER49]|uniref:hypothetical protein n=1 Tax=Amnibacterium sp. CER49 TaxID=3039161 RepID=UPI00244AC211|nr:hypothetical protein [Amnibacterium sp. CER49]MDH2443945.1 hypothetical protein [Amnibacterium sp. CER49]